VIYRFDITRADSSHEVIERDLPDDFAAVEWMGNECMLHGDSMLGFRGDEPQPFARREFAGDVAVFG
jgi:hypothetical protein